jgi:hypothetical protein
MKDLSRRDLLRASAGAAIVAVPMIALAGPSATAATTDADTDADADSSATLASSGTVMFCVHDAARGEVSILHGTSEVIVTDRRLVAQIMKAANVRQNG